MERVLQQLDPCRVFQYFEELCAIPHGSGNTDAISAYCVNFARAHGLDCERDEWNNVIIRKPAFAGYEVCPTVILQGHLDMVCEQAPDCSLNMETEGLILKTDGEWIWAEGTTLGGDDGIAVAMVLAMLEDETLPHPPLEALFTTDEETGMYGAAGLDSHRIQGRILINIDSEQEGVLTVGCAGGARAQLTLPVSREALKLPCVKVIVSGLKGGHSGVEIDKGRLNANVVMGRFLQSLDSDYRLVSLQGGNKDNAIPREAECVLGINGDITAVAAAFTKNHAVKTDPQLTITITPVPSAETALTVEDSARVAAFLCEVPNGIIAMTEAIPDLVQTSLNLGVLRLENTQLTVTFAVRSSLGTDKTALLQRLDEVAAVFGGRCDTHGHYPAWEYRARSPLREVMTAVYRRLYGDEAVVEIIHAGLECGLLSEKLDGLDAVSLGPDMQGIHTTAERLNVASVARTYTYLCEVLKAMKE